MGFLLLSLFAFAQGLLHGCDFTLLYPLWRYLLLAFLLYELYFVAYSFACLCFRYGIRLSGWFRTGWNNSICGSHQRTMRKRERDWAGLHILSDMHSGGWMHTCNKIGAIYVLKFFCQSIYPDGRFKPVMLQESCRY